MEVKSVRKTWHALTVGAGIQQGRLTSYDELISDYVAGLSGNDALVTYRHVMTQSSAFDYPGCDDPTDYLPGEIWTYSDYNPYYLNRALASAYERPYSRDGYTSLLREAYFDAIGMQGWRVTVNTKELGGLGDGIRLFLDLEDMGRLGLLVLADGVWDGQRLIAPGFVDEFETKQVYGMPAVYDGCNGSFNLDPDQFPEAPYGFMTWVNTDGDYYPGAGADWTWSSGNGGFYVLWNRSNGIVFAATGAKFAPGSNSFPHILEANITGPNPLFGE
jgi:CubicO group peptidase (beta-lactamase class C family)